MAREPLIVIQLGGMTLFWAVLGVFTAFGHGPNATQATALGGLMQVVLTIIARTQVTPTPPPPIAPPMSTPPGGGK